MTAGLPYGGVAGGGGGGGCLKFRPTARLPTRTPGKVMAILRIESAAWSEKLPTAERVEANNDIGYKTAAHNCSPVSPCFAPAPAAPVPEPVPAFAVPS